jgi:probable rRNA maturation factor
VITVDVSVATRKFTIDRELLERAVKAALAGRVADATVSITVVGDDRMRQLNKLTLGHDYVTDVLSSDHGETPEGLLLEVIVCAPFGARQSVAHGVPFKQELARYVIHGCLHCAGLEDDSEKTRAAMWVQQERVMKRVFGNAYVQTTA